MSTGMIAFVFLELWFCFNCSMSMLYVFGSISTNTGVAPNWEILLLQTQRKVNGVVITSSPGFMPSASKPSTGRLSHLQRQSHVLLRNSLLSLFQRLLFLDQYIMHHWLYLYATTRLDFVVNVLYCTFKI